ncbi:hypothetical protein ACO0SA_000379 [Hanseniaspora valbyensis]
MSSILSKSNSFKRFRSDSANTINNHGDTESLSSNTNNKPKLFSKKSMKIFGGNNNNSTSNVNEHNNSNGNSSGSSNNTSNKNIVVRLNDYNRSNSISTPHLSTTTHNNLTSTNTHLRTNTRANNMSLNRSTSLTVVNTNNQLIERRIQKLEADIEIPNDYLILLENKSTETNLVKITLFGKEDRRLKESLILKDDINYEKITKLLTINKNRKLQITNFNTEYYLQILEKIMVLEMNVLEYFINLTNENGWVSYKEITELKQRLNLLSSNWQKRIDFYRENLVIS